MSATAKEVEEDQARAKPLRIVRPSSVAPGKAAVREAVWSSALPYTEKLVLLAVHDFCERYKRAFPSVETLCVRATLAERTVRKALKALKARGWLNVQVRRGRDLQGHWGQLSSVYRVMVPATPRAAP